MAQTIQIKRSTSTTTPSSLSAGELAYSGKSDSNKLFIGHPDGTTGPVAIGGQYYTGVIDGAASANTASKLVLRDGSGNFSAGTISATFTGDLTGDVTGNADTATALETGRTLAITGDLAYTSPSFTGAGNVTAAGTLATVNSNVGSFGTATAIPAITVNAKGLVTAVSTNSISSSFTLAADSGTNDTFNNGETLTLTGGTGVATTVSNNSVSFAIGQAVATTSNVTFNNVQVDGTLTSDDITSTNISVAGNATITGNLTVQGTTTTVNSTAVAIGDNIMVLNKDEAGTPSANAGIEIERGTATNVSLLWNETNDNWTVSNGSATSVLLTAANFNSVYTGTIDGGSF
jgi:cytoskeletal protein CcmA (bactofilin family)